MKVYTPEERIAIIDDLLQKGLLTADEHARATAALRAPDAPPGPERPPVDMSSPEFGALIVRANDLLGQCAITSEEYLQLVSGDLSLAEIDAREAARHEMTDIDKNPKKEATISPAMSERVQIYTDILAIPGLLSKDECLKLIDGQGLPPGLKERLPEELRLRLEASEKEVAQ
jgi:hypothetical protein